MLRFVSQYVNYSNYSKTYFNMSVCIVIYIDYLYLVMNWKVELYVNKICVSSFS